MYNTFIIPKDIHCLKTMEYRNQKSATCCKYNKPHSYPAEDEGSENYPLSTPNKSLEVTHLGL